MMTTPSRRFEEVTRAILNRMREQFGFATVEGSKTYAAKDSGVKRQIDVTIYAVDVRHFIVECKLHTAPVDINYVDAFHTVIHTDVGADGGILVSSSGFTNGAAKSAAAKHIKLITLNSGATEENYRLEMENAIYICMTDTNLTTEEYTAIAIPIEPGTEDERN